MQRFDCLAFTLEMPFKDSASLPRDRANPADVRPGSWHSHDSERKRQEMEMYHPGGKSLHFDVILTSF